MEHKPLCIVTGLSGSGKSTALRAFEDLNFFTVDGLPAILAPEMANMLNRPDMRHFNGIAIGMDLRESGFIEEFGKALARLKAEGRQPTVIFFDASDEDLLRRYAATRRPHPLERGGTGVASAIQAERKLLSELKSRADLIIDSSGYSVHDLKRVILSRYGAEQARSLRVIVISFGFKHGLPEDADYVFDVRFLDNPYFVPELRQGSGLDAPVAEYVFRNGVADAFLRKMMAFLEFVLEQLADDGRGRVTIAFGCTGGRHRSVALAQRVSAELRGCGYTVLIEHRNINDDGRLEA